MRCIRDNEPPQELIDWCARQRGVGVNLHFDSLGRVEVKGVKGDVKNAIRQSRLLDQGYLCAYTMVRIDANDCHLEHIIPRTVSNQAGRPEETVQYRNIVACFPLNGKCEFGAHAREDRRLPITPLDQSCESRIRYLSNGEASPRIPGDQDVKDLINQNGNLLCLNHPTLVKLRRAAVDVAGLSQKSMKPLRQAEARRFAEKIQSFKRGDRLPSFCIALIQAAEAHIERLNKLANKRRYARRKPL